MVSRKPVSRNAIILPKPFTHSSFGKRYGAEFVRFCEQRLGGKEGLQKALGQSDLHIIKRLFREFQAK